MSNLVSGMAPINGTQLYYEMAGQGHPLVMVHAGVADCRMWDSQFETFAADFRVIRYDMRGFGKSPLVEGEYSHHEDLHALVKYLNIDRAYLMGCSKGGGTIMDMALTYPAMTAALIMVASGPNGFSSDSQEPPQWQEAIKAFEANELERVSELEVQIWVDGPQRTSDQVAPWIRDLVREMNLIALKNEKLKIGTEKRLEPMTTNRLGEIKAPTLIITGTLDQPHLALAGQYMFENIAGAQKIEIEAAHLPNMEKPAEFNQHVRAFLKGLGKS